MNKKIYVILLVMIVFINFNTRPVYAKTIQAVDSYTKSNGGQIVDYNNLMWTYINEETGEYNLQIPELGDYDFSCNSKEELDRLVLEYKSHVEDPFDACNIIKNLYETNKTINDNGDVVIDYSNNSYAIYNIEKNIYQFYPAETNDYPVELNSVEQLYNCIATYKECR